MSGAALVIAHRGASGYLPEHTREAKVLAYGQGADFLEQDVVATRDGALVVLHDSYLDDVTDVGVRFPERSRADGRYYVIDFDLEEIATLRVHERRRGARAAFPGRFADESVAFRVVTLDEELRLIGELNRTTGRRVGVYPEIKYPDWHRAHGIDLAQRVLELLDAHGYRRADDPVFVQCFDPAELRRCRDRLGTRVRLAQLVAAESPAAALSPRALASIAEYADVVAPHYSQLTHVGGGGIVPSPAAHDASAAGLELHPYTFRADALPPHAADLRSLLELFIVGVGAAGVFCDQPDVAVAVRDLALARRAAP